MRYSFTKRDYFVLKKLRGDKMRKNDSSIKKTKVRKIQKRERKNKKYNEGDNVERIQERLQKRTQDKRVKDNKEFDVHDNDLLLGKIKYFFGESDIQEYVDDIFTI